MAAPPRSLSAITALKQRCEDRLKHDEAKVKFLQDSVDTTSKTVDSMVGSARASQRLRSRDNLKKLLDLAKHVETYYGASIKLAPILEPGPAYNLEGYLAALKQLEEANLYFQRNNPRHPDVAHIQTLRRRAHQMMEKEFTTLVERFSVAADRDAVVMALEEQERDLERHGRLGEAPLALESDTVETLAGLVGWLEQTDEHAQCVKQYVKQRSRCMNDLMATARDESPLITPQSSLPRARSQINSKTPTRGFLRRPSEVRARRNTEASVLGRSHDSAAINYVQGTDPVLQHIRAFLAGARQELTLVQNIFSEDLQAAILHDVVLPAMEALRTSVRTMLDNSNRHLTEHSFFNLLNIYDVVTELHRKEPCFAAVLRYTEDGMFQAYMGMMLSVAEFGRRVTLEFQDMINTDASKKLPLDATVNELTAQALKFVNHAIDYREAVATVLRPDLAATRGELNWLKGEDANNMFCDWLRPVISTLTSNLLRKSRGYEDESVAAVFLLNNYSYIVRSLDSERFRDVMGQAASA
ncbi:uncharacterized protein MONBRDRAFT_34559, partial [Monosiga brevicollis MX1]